MRKRITKYKHLHSNRFRYLYSSIPLISASGLLVVGSMMLGCIDSESIVLAEGIADDMSAYDTMALSTTGVTLSLDDDEQGSDLRADVVAGEVAYIRKGFKVSAEGDYNIYVQSSTGTSDLVSGTASIPTLSTNNVKMDTVESSAWGYTVAPNAPAASSLTYNTIPTTSTSSIQSGSKVENQPYSLYFAALFDGKEAAGHYRSNIVLSLAATPEEVTNYYSITYDANGSTAGITPVMQAAESNNDTYYFALSEGLDLRKSGYSFIGWAEDKNAVDPKYIAGSTISLSSDKPNKILYAVWREDKAWDDITTMQELTPNTCRGGLAPNTSKQLIDERDNKSYWVTKLADGNCWMTQNLDYDIKTTDIANVIRFDEKTGVSAWLETYDGVARYYDPGDFYKTDTDNWSSTGCNGVAEGFASAGCTATAGWKTTAVSEEEKHFHVGNFYNWYAATNNTWRNASTIDAVAPDSICPSGWDLPLSGIDANASYGTPLLNTDQVTTDTKSLAGVYAITRSRTDAAMLRKEPFYFTPGGYIIPGALSYAGNYSFYWSSSAATAARAFQMGSTSTHVNPAKSLFFYYGLSIRCLVPGA